MGKPRLIILIRHAQSEGNKNRDIHQYTPDHRVPLTSDGWAQAEEAGRRLKSLLRKDDTIRIFTSPYRRTRETTEGILRTLTADDPDDPDSDDATVAPSPFQREHIKVYEEPRIREQDFGNYQYCRPEMDRIWQERADYGHFFYRIPNGESAADAYDRVSGFNESLWRQFGDDDFPSVCILVTHGLMTRIFLMKWYHWSVEYFEDLRNIHHCELITMQRDEDTKKYLLQNDLRTWSELHRRENGGVDPPSPKLSSWRWGGCAMGCNHHKIPFPKRTKRASIVDMAAAAKAGEKNNNNNNNNSNEQEDSPATAADTEAIASPSRSRSVKRFTSSTILHDYEKVPRPDKKPTGVAVVHASSADDEDADDDDDDDDDDDTDGIEVTNRHHHHLRVGRDGGGSRSGVGSPAGISDDSDYFDVRLQSVNRALAATRSEVSRSALSQVAEVADGQGQGPGQGQTSRRASTPRAGSRSRPRKSSAASVKRVLISKTSDLEQAIRDGRLDADEGTPAGDVY